MHASNYVLEWSCSQACFHVETAAEMLKRNLDALISNRSNDYVPLALGLTHREANDLAEQIKQRQGLDSMQELAAKMAALG